ncbi:MAG: SAM-dependent methyltransferase, partial [bacterium]|nr:SAM-dependent methyltransferase [bacterium]
KNGVVVTDNINFHGLVKQELTSIESRNLRGLVKKIKKYINFLQNNLKYKTTFYEIGDGVSVTEKRG